MKPVVALVLSLLAMPAFATVEAWPALYDVSDVAADDVLNIRAAPDAGADIVGTLDPTATNIEVIRINEAETWGLVNAGERSGWVSLRFLNRHPDQWAGRFPPISRCYGTEPFWDIRVNGDRLDLSVFGEALVSEATILRTRSSNRLDRFGLVGVTMSAVILEQSCNDGMSDRDFGIAIEVLAPPPMSDPGAPSPGFGEVIQYSGCCTIQP